MYDLIIVGGGPAGLTAGVYAARKRLKMALITKEFGGQPMWTKSVENYMGFQFVSGPELMVKFDEQIRQFPIDLKYEEVVEIKREEKHLEVVTNLGTYSAKTVILASGKRPKKLGVPGEEEYIGRGVAYCATCDGPFFKGKKVAVVGSGNSAIEAVLELSEIATEVHLISRTDEHTADIVLVEKLGNLTNLIEHRLSEITQILGSEQVEAVEFKKLGSDEKQTIPIDGIFVEIGLDPNSQMVKSLVKLNRLEEIEVNSSSETGIPGLFAAGDVTDGPEKQIIIAAGEGSKAALVAYNYLLRLKDE